MSKKDKIQNFDHKCYRKSFVKPMRDILMKYPVVWNGEQYIKLTDVNLPLIKYYRDPEIRKQAYNYIFQVYNGNVPTYEESLQFESYIWRKDERIKYIGMEECIHYISEQRTVVVLSDKMSISDIWEWIDNFITFIKKNENELLEQYSIIPNQNGAFHRSDELYEDIQIPEIFKECMKNSFNYGIKNELINDFRDNKLSLKSLINGRERNILDYINDLKDYFQSNSIPLKNKQKASRYLIQIILKKTEDNKCEWQNEQRNLFNIYIIFIKNDIEYYEIENKYCDKGLWRDANEHICDEITFIIEKCEVINELRSILNIGNKYNDKDKIFEYLNIINKFRKEGKIVPNQYEQFCHLNDLYNEGITNIETTNIELIPEEHKEMAKDLGYDIRNSLVHQNNEGICRNSVSERELMKK